MSIRAVFWKWTAIGVMFAALVVGVGAPQVGGLAGMLRVGVDSELRPLITEQLGEIPLTMGSGHDGQYYYAIGLDLLGSEVPALFEDSGFRYRRILLPAFSSLFGVLEGWPLLYGLVAVSILSYGLATGLLASLAKRLGLSELTALAVLPNPGTLLSLRLLTGDVLAMALMIAGLSAAARRANGRGGVLFAGSTLSKDAFLLTPLGLGLPSLRTRWPLVVVPLASFGIWVAWILAQMGGGLAGEGNFGAPFRGILDAFAEFATLPGEARFYLVLASLLVGLAGLFAFRRTWMRWPLAIWTLVGVLSSYMVWGNGNNALRVFAPIVVLLVLSLRTPANGATTSDSSASQ